MAVVLAALAACGRPGESEVRRFLEAEYPGLEVTSISLNKRAFGGPADSHPRYRLNGTAVVRLTKPAYDSLEWTDVVRACGARGRPPRPDGAPFVLRPAAPAGTELYLEFESDAHREGRDGYEIEFRRGSFTDPETQKPFPHGPISRYHVKFGYVVLGTPEFRALCDRHVKEADR